MVYWHAFHLAEIWMVDVSVYMIHGWSGNIRCMSTRVSLPQISQTYSHVTQKVHWKRSIATDIYSRAYPVNLFAK